MIKIKISGQLLTTVRDEMLKRDDDLFRFLLQLVSFLYKNKDKMVDVSFTMFLSTLEYSSLRVLHFSEELPVLLPFCGDISFSVEYGAFIFDVERLFDPEIDLVQYMRFGSGISSLLR